MSDVEDLGPAPALSPRESVAVSNQAAIGWGVVCLVLEVSGLATVVLFPPLGVFLCLLGFGVWPIYGRAWLLSERMSLRWEVFKAVALAVCPTVPLAFVILLVVDDALGTHLESTPLLRAAPNPLSVLVTCFCCLTLLALVVQGYRRR